MFSSFPVNSPNGSAKNYYKKSKPPLVIAKNLNFYAIPQEELQNLLTKRIGKNQNSNMSCNVLEKKESIHTSPRRDASGEPIIDELITLPPSVFFPSNKK